MKFVSLKFVFVLALAVVTLAGSPISVPTAEAHSHCPPEVCPDVYSPVICSNDQVYMNICFAYRDCQKDCWPYD